MRISAVAWMRRGGAAEPVDQIAVGWTEYHRCLSNLSEKDSDDDEDGDTETVVAIYV